MLKKILSAVVAALFTVNLSLADEEPAENASNPLAAVNNTDFRIKTYDLGEADRNEFYLDGAVMLNPKVKLKYETHYWDTDVSGRDEQDWESISGKLLYFPKEGELKSGLPYRLTVGLEWIVDLGDQEKGIGTGADQIAPLAGIAISYKPGLMLIPLLQHFESYSGNDVSQTSSRLIALKTLSNDKWLKTDLKIPYDWENDSWPASAELQYGKSLTPKLGVYMDLQGGIGADRPYDYVVGVGLRVNY